MSQIRLDTRSRTAREYAVSLALMAIIALLPIFVSNLYWQGVIIVGVYYALLAVAWNLQFGYVGQISIAPAAFAMIGAYVTGMVCFHLSVSPFWGIVSAVLSTLVLGAALGTIVLRLKGPYLALTTLAFAEIARNVIVASHDLTRGDAGLPVPPIVNDRLVWYYVFLAVLFIVQTGIFFLLRSPAGLYFQAIRDDETGAAARGVKVVFWKIAVFIIGSVICGLAGAMYAHFARVATPEIGLLYQAAVIIAMVVIGGAGSMVGPIFGAMFVWALTEFLRDAGAYQGLVFAMLILLFARFYPRGTWGFIESRREKRLQSAAGAPALKAKA